MKSMKDSLLERRSIRRYEREPITDEQMDLIYEAIRNTPTSYNGQQFSVIDITDQTIKEQIYNLTGQKQIKTCNHFMLFLIDYHKISLISDAENLDMPNFEHTVDGLIVGVVDATLAMMSAVAMAESLGLGTCPIGYARTVAPEALSSMMKLPKKTLSRARSSPRISRPQAQAAPEPRYSQEHISSGRRGDGFRAQEI